MCSFPRKGVSLTSTLKSTVWEISRNRRERWVSTIATRTKTHWVNPLSHPLLYLFLSPNQTRINPTLSSSLPLSSSFTFLSARSFVHHYHIFSFLYPFPSFHHFQIGQPAFLHVTIVFFTSSSPVIFSPCLSSLFTNYMRLSLFF